MVAALCPRTTPRQQQEHISALYESSKCDLSIELGNGEIDVLDAGCFRKTCQPGFYKAFAGNVKCAKCPPHSSTNVEGSTNCKCEKNYFRSEGDVPSMACTRPPSAPRNVISNINETSVILDWSWPLDTGGRKDVTFNIVCKKCGGTSKLCEPCSNIVRFLPHQMGLSNTTVTVVDLLAHTNYTFEIDAVNGVSDLSTFPRQFAAVSITTNQAAPSPITTIRKDRTSRNSVSLSWQEPEHPNGIILDYEVKYYEKQEQETSYTILRAKTTNVTINGLKPDTTYVFQIRARTAAGYGTNSRKFEFETSPDSFSISSENSQVVMIAVSAAVAIILLTIVVYILIGRFCGHNKSKHGSDEKRLYFVKLPGLRTYVDPHTYEDPNLAVHEFARELEASSIAIDKVVGAGKPVMIVTEYMENGSLDSFLRVIKAVEEGYRLPPPMDCPAALYQMMLDCWQKDRNNRPKFEQIVSVLDKLIRNPSSLKIITNAAARPSNLLLDQSSIEISPFRSTSDWINGIRIGQCKDIFTGVEYSSCDTIANISSDDMKKVGVTIVGPQKKLISSIKSLEMHTKNGPVPV
ncbi:Ephrin type-A receptor 3, partial [Ophiophagus hannah]